MGKLVSLFSESHIVKIQDRGYKLILTMIQKRTLEEAKLNLSAISNLKAMNDLILYEVGHWHGLFDRKSLNLIKVEFIFPLVFEYVPLDDDLKQVIKNCGGIEVEISTGIKINFEENRLSAEDYITTVNEGLNLLSGTNLNNN